MSLSSEQIKERISIIRSFTNEQLLGELYNYVNDYLTEYSFEYHFIEIELRRRLNERGETFDNE